MLTTLERNVSRPDIECPGDTIPYKCSIQSNSENIFLRWQVSIPGQIPLTITYDSTSMPNSNEALSAHVRSTLTSFVSQSYVESVIEVEVPRGVSFNNTMVECSFSTLTTDMVTVLVDSAGTCYGF